MSVFALGEAAVVLHVQGHSVASEPMQGGSVGFRYRHRRNRGQVAGFRIAWAGEVVVQDGHPVTEVVQVDRRAAVVEEHDLATEELDLSIFLIVCVRYSPLGQDRPVWEWVWVRL